MLWLGSALDVYASSATKEIDRVNAADDYQTLTVTLTTPAFTDQVVVEGEVTGATGDLQPADFTLTGAPGVAITGVADAGSNQSWTLTLDGPVAPHDATVGIVAGQVYESDGTAFPADAEPVPLSDGAVANLLDALQEVAVPLAHEAAATADDVREVANLPLVGAWFENIVDDVPTDRLLSDVVGGLDALGDAADDSQEALEGALEGLPGIADAAFVDGGLTLDFDDTATAATRTMSGAVGVDALDLSFAGTPSVGLRLDGALRLVATGTSVAVDASTAPFEVVLDTSVQLDLAASLGFAELAAPDASIAYNGTTIAVDLTCPTASPCAPGDVDATVDVAAGTASLTVPTLELTDGAGTEVFDAAPDDLVTIQFTDLTDLGDLSAVTVDENLGELLNLSNMDLGRALASLQFVAAWLADVEQFDALGFDLPVAGGQLGDLAKVGPELAGRIADVLNGISADTSAQDLVQRLCEAELVDIDAADCATSLAPLTIGTDSIEYAIDLSIARAEGTGTDDLTAPANLGLGIGDALDGLSLSEVAGNVDIAVDADLGLTLGLDLRPDAELMTAFGLDADDFDDDGTPNGTDDNADGDTQVDTVDQDDDADGLPETYALRPGDLCRTTAAIAGMGTDAFAAANGLDTAGDDRTAQLEACDALIVAGDDVSFGSSDPTHTLTADEVCFAGASLFLIPDPALADPVGATNDTFRTRNGYADAAACAAAVSAGTGTFNYDDVVALGSPVGLAQRAYIGEITDPVLSAGMTVTGTGLAVQGRLGFLDIALTGAISLEPSVDVVLVDPGTADPDDNRITMGELAEAADTDSLGDIADLTIAGDVDVHFQLLNSTIFPAPLHLDVVGDFSALDNAPSDIFQFHTTALPDDTGLATDRIHVGTDLGDFLNFEEIGAAQIRQLIRQFADRMIELARSSALDLEIPFIGVRTHEMLDFAEKWAAVADQVLARDPQTASALAQALRDALAANGFPTTLDFAIDDDALLIGFDGSTQLTRTYPFSLDALGGLPAIAPADGGASVTASAALTFSPSLGIDLDATSVEDALFIDDPDLDFTATLDADVFGSVHLGPITTGIDGHLDVAASLGVDVDTGADSRLTLDELADGIADGTLLDISFDGPINGVLDVTNPTGTITISGNLNDLGNLDVDADIDLSSITLDLDTLIEGLIESTRFIGRLLAQSDDLNLELPLIGDGLDGAADLGNRMVALADQIRALRASAPDAQAFIDGLESSMNTALGCTCVDIQVLDAEGNPASFASAEEVSISFLFGFDHAPAPATIDEGIGLDGVFEAGIAFTGQYEFGYNAGFSIGFDRTDGFYLDDPVGGSLLELYAGLSATGINGSVDIFDVPLASVVNGSASIGGAGADGLGPRNTAAGFSVTLPERLTLNDIANRTSDIDQVFDAGFDVGVAIDLPLETASSVGPVPLPTLNVPLLFDWEVEGFDAGAPSLSLGTEDRQITLDVASLIGDCAGTACTGLIAPVFETLGEYNPLAKDPIGSILTDEIPVVEQNILELAESLGVADTAFLQFLASLDGTVPSIDLDDATIEFGWVDVLPTFQLHENETPWQCQATQLVEGLEELFQFLLDIDGCSSLPTPIAAGGDADGPTFFSAAAPASTFEAGPLQVDIPLLDDPAKILTLLLGPDVAQPFSLIEVRFGSGDVPFNIGLGFNFSATLFELNTGFLDGSLKVSFGGGLGLQLRLGIGYDTTGLKSGRSLLDGFYLVDFRNGAGVDVQEISGGGFVAGTIDGRFGVLGDLASVHFKGSAGINLTAGIDFFDESVAIPENERGDSRFHLYEMNKVMEAHQFPGTDEPAYGVIDAVGFELDDILCIFRPELDFSAYISFSGKAKVLGVTVFDESFSESFSIIPGGPLSVNCPLGIRIAQIVDGQLVLNGGPEYAGDRFDGLGDIDERFRLTRTGDHVFVDWLGAGSGYNQLRFDVADIPRGVYGDLGAGADEVDVANDLGLPVVLRGGDGDDVLEGSNLGDDIDGGGGNDTLRPGGGDDVAVGGAGNDDIDGGTGNDVLEGGSGDDRYRFGDGWGVEALDDPVGTETLDFSAVTTALTGDAFFGEGEVRNGANRLSYLESDVEVILGGAAGDTFTFKPSAPDGLRFDGQGGGDLATVQLSGQERTLNFHDTGSAGDDRIVADGTASNDTFLFRGQVDGLSAANAHTNATTGAAADHGFLALISPTDQVDRVDHTDSIELVEAVGGIGDDTFAFDDNASGEHTTATGGPGDDTFQVGQIFGDARTLRETDGSPVDPASLCRATPDNITSPPSDFPRCVGLRDGLVGIDDEDDWFATRDTTRGFLSNGITHPATLNGGEGNDFFQVYANRAELDLNGNNGDDTFIVRAFALEGSVSDAVVNSLGLDIGVDAGDGVDYVEYAQNAPVTIDGGEGFDTFVIVGTEFQDGILVADGNAKICAVAPGGLTTGTLNLAECAFSAISFSNIESVGVQALGGNDLVLALSTSTTFQTRVFGGDHDDVVFFGRDPANPSSAPGGDLTGIQGPLTVLGESDPTFDEAIAEAITLPGETAGDAEPPSPLAGGTNEGDTGIIDARASSAGDVGAIDEITQDDVEVLNLTGMGLGTGTTIGGVALPPGIVFDAIDFVDVRLGSGADTLTVDGTHDLQRDLDGDNDIEDVPGTVDTDGMNAAAPVKVLFGDDVAPLRIQGGAGADTVNLRTIDVATRVLGGDGDDTTNVGSEEPDDPSLLESIDALVEVDGGAADAADTLHLDDRAETDDQTVDVEQALVTGLGLHELGVAYGGVEVLDIDLGTVDEVANVRGTVATTTVHGNDGDERYYVSDVADLDNDTTTDHLLGTLDDIDGALTLDSDAGRHLLMVSDEDAGAGDPTAVITDTTIDGLAPAGITYLTGGSWADGVTVWASQHDDGITLDGTHLASGVRTVSTLNAGAGADTVTVDLAAGTHDFAVVNGEQGDDTVDGATSSLGLVVFGGEGADTIGTGSGNDIVLGDVGRVNYLPAATGTTVGGGGPGDRTDGAIVPFDSIESPNAPVGGDDSILAGAGDDVVLGQHADDTIGGGEGNDELTGGHNVAGGLDGDDSIDGGSGNDRIAGDNAKVEPGETIVLRDVETTTTGAADASFHGADGIHGGAGDDVAFGQGDDDDLDGDEGDDVLEGNRGEDTVFGGPDDDDVIGGGSANDGVIDADRVGNGLLDEGDRLFGDDRDEAGSDPTDGHDVLIGDNGRIDRTGQLNPVAGATYPDRPLRSVVLDTTAPGATSGSDFVRGNGGDDDLYGQYDDGSASTLAGVGCVDGEVLASVSGDLLCGDAGDDGVLGDRGTIVSRKAEDLRPAGEERVQTRSPFIDETIYVRGTVVRVVTLDPIAVGGHDVAFGGDGADAIHVGEGNDLANGGAGDDVVFGANGVDALWGDLGHDRMYGGHGGDFLDVKPRQGVPGVADDPASWFVVSPLVDRDGTASTTNESDVIYGGFDQDALQADEGSAGPRPGDRLVDWAGAYNAYYVCDGAYGAGQALREFSPEMVNVLRTLATGDGAVDVATAGRSGFVELALVDRQDVRANSNPAHPDTPAHFTCEPLP